MNLNPYKYTKEWLEGKIWDMADRYPTMVAANSWTTCIMGRIILEEARAGCGTDAFERVRRTLLISAATSNLTARAMNLNDSGMKWGEIPMRLGLKAPAEVVKVPVVVEAPPPPVWKVPRKAGTITFDWVNDMLSKVENVPTVKQEEPELLEV